MRKQKLMLTTKLLEIIIEMAEQGEDYSLIQRNYNELVEEYNLPLQKVRWISNTEFEFIDQKVRVIT